LRGGGVYKIKPVLLGKVVQSKGRMTYFFGDLERIDSAIVFWYIEGGDKVVLVDTGISEPELKKYSFGMPYEELQSFEEALSKFGLKPDDIDIIIQTHLHFDHCANTRKCRNAKVYVQLEELKFAYSPHALFAGSYPLEFLKDIDFRTVEGDREILPGIRVVLTPGHTPGCQSVLIETEKGVSAISGFCSIRENFFPPERIRGRWPVMAPGVSVNSLQAFDSALKLKSMADIIIPSHDIEMACKEELP